MCNSWRCTVCRRHEAAISYARTEAAFERIEGITFRTEGTLEDLETAPTLEDLTATTSGFDPSRLGFFVLTLDRDGFFSGSPWKNERAAYAALGMMARKFLKRLNRLAVKQEVEPPGNRWVATVEAHKSGWPHYQLLIYLPEEWRDELPDKEGFRIGWSEFSEELRAHATAVGWGKRSSFERVRDAKASLGYLIGTAGKHEASIGELAKLTQLPLNAPARFRRLRSGKGFLPPRWKGKKTGTLIRRMRCHDGTFQAMALHELHSPLAREVSGECCYQEERVWEMERGVRKALGPRVLDSLSSTEREKILPRMWSFEPNLARGPPALC